MRFAWCSISVTTTSSPGPSAKVSAAMIPSFASGWVPPPPAAPLEKAYATRLIDSVAFLVKTISSARAPMNRATVSRAAS
jgi:hypothetical protein